MTERGLPKENEKILNSTPDCPECGHRDIDDGGRDKDGIDDYRCHGCGWSWNESANAPKADGDSR